MKINKKNSLLWVLPFLLFASCSKDETPNIDDNFLNYQISEVPVTKDIPVGVFYYNTGSTGITQAIYDRLLEIPDAVSGKVGPYIRPTLGKYGSTTNATSVGIMQQHIDWGIQGGIDFFILPGLTDITSDVYPNNINTDNLRFINLFIGEIGSDGKTQDITTGTKTNLKSIKYALSINLGNLSSGLSNTVLIENVAPTSIKGSLVTRVQRFNDTFKRIADYFSDPTYYTVDGKPLVVLINPHQIYARSSDSLYTNMRKYVKDYCGKDMYLVAQQPNWSPPARYEYFYINGKVDAITHVNMLNQSSYYDRSYWYPQLIDQNWKYSKDYFMANWNIDYIPTASPSFNYYPNAGNNYNYPIVPKSPDMFRKFCNVAKMNLGKNRIVFIDSFNQWSQDTSVEPTDSIYGNGYGTTYLNIIKEQFKVK